MAVETISTTIPVGDVVLDFPVLPNSPIDRGLLFSVRVYPADATEGTA